MAIGKAVLNKMILLGERHVRHVIEEYLEHHNNNERPHQGIGNLRINEPEHPPPRDGPVRCRERLGGLPKSHFREVA